MTMDPPRTTDEGRRTWPRLNSAERGALREVLIHGPLPRAEIARRLGMSRASLTRVARTLVELGLIREGAVEQRAWTGRPSELFEIAPGARHFFGVKLTGDTIYATVTDLAARQVATTVEPIESRDVDDVVERISVVFHSFAERFDDIVAAGVCLAGELTHDRSVVVRSPFLGWRDVPLAAMLSARLGVPVATENDVRGLTAAEHWFGAGAGCTSLALVTVGTGIGFGFVVDDKMLAGAHGRAGRLDHLGVDDAGPVCPEGHRGCASVYLTSDSIVRAVHGAETDYSGVVALAREGHAGALRAFRDAGAALGKILGTIANTLDPQKFILTGDGLAVWELAEAEATAAVQATVSRGGDPVVVDVQPFEFDEWARAAAVVGIRTVLRF